MWFDTSSNPRHSVVEGFSAPASPLGPCPALRASSVRRHSERISANGGGAMPITDEGSTETVTTVDRRTLAFCRWGDPDGAPVFYLHGTPGSRFLRHSEDEYRRNRLGVYTYDRPGYGLSTRLRGRKMADTAADVRAIADAVGLGEFGVAGVSGGAAPALACGALLPDRVTRCATVVGAAPFTAEGLDVFDGMDEEARTEWALPLRGEEAIERDWLETVDWIEQGLPGVDAPGRLRGGDAAGVARLRRRHALRGPRMGVLLVRRPRADPADDGPRRRDPSRARRLARAAPAERSGGLGRRRTLRSPGRAGDGADDLGRARRGRLSDFQWCVRQYAAPGWPVEDPLGRQKPPIAAVRTRTRVTTD